MSNSFSNRTRGLLLAACVLAVLFVPAAEGTPGALDPSFGTGGTVTTNFAGASSDRAYALVRQPDGKLVAAGDTKNGSIEEFALARYNANGKLDPGFGSGGIVTTAIGSGDDFVDALTLQPDGKLIAAGETFNGPNGHFALVRYNPDGNPDPTFGSGGIVTTAFGPSDDEALGVAVQPDGKIVAAGSAYTGSRYEFAVARYTADGKLDPSFGPGSNGKVTTPLGDSGGANALALQPDGKIVAAGAVPVASNWDFALVRYNSDGSLDTSFNGTGEVTTPIGPSEDSAYTIVAQPDGKLVAAGYAASGASAEFALARYNPDGKLDPGFGSGGKVTTPLGTGSNKVCGLVLQPDGKIVAAGNSGSASDPDFGLVRYNPDGTLDLGFGSGGKITTAFGTGAEAARAVALQPDGKLVAAGYASNGSDPDFAIARYANGSTLTVAKAGSGSGTVTSTPNGIDCGATCAAGFDAGPITLTATPSAGSHFAGWSGACSGTGACTLTMDGDHAATATFEADPPPPAGPETLAVAKAGRGVGTVSSSPNGISCGSSCTFAFVHGATVTLSAAASAASRFAGWSGACSGTATCSVAMSEARSVTATFDALCVVPKLKGKTLRAAKLALAKAHCALGKVTRASSAKVKKGHVIGSKPTAGTKLAAGSQVKLRVSSGKRA